MERCPVCGKLLLGDVGGGEKRCYSDDCSARVYSDGSYSVLRRDADKIRRIQKFPDGKEKVIREYSYL